MRGRTSADARDESVELRLGHLERRQQFGAEQAIADRADAVLRAQLDRRPPDHDLRIADIDIPPTRRAPFRRDVVTDALLADEEDQRLSAGPTGVELREPHGIVRLQALGVRPDGGLVEEWQAGKILRTAHRRRIEPEAGEEIAVVRDMRAGVDEQLAQALDAQRLEALGGPPLRILHRLTHGDGGVLLGPALERKQQAGGEPCVQRRHACTASRQIARNSPTSVSTRSVHWLPRA